MRRLGDRQPGVFRHPGFTRFWAADSVSGFGTYITTFALQVLVVLTLHGSAALLWLSGMLTLPILLAVTAAFGALSLLNDAANQSFLPRLVPGSSLLAANARLDQSAAVAQTSGPLVAGRLAAALGAPVAVAAGALSYLVSGAAVARIRVAEPASRRHDPAPSLLREIRQGVTWVYRHSALAPLAITTHAWFLVNSILVTVFVPFSLHTLGLTAFELGAALAAAGAGSLIGSLLAARTGRRWGAGRTVIACRAVMPVGWSIIALAPASGQAPSHWLGVAAAGAGQLVYGLAIGVENANEMGYRQAATPDVLQSRMNTTIRSVNRAVIVVAAPLGGLVADTVGYRPVLWAGAAGFAVVAGALAVSPFRHARHTDAPSSAVA